MALEYINLGVVANDGTGDDLREAFLKINRNFEDIDLRNDEKTRVLNLGEVGEGIFHNLVNYQIQLKKIAAGENTVLVADDEKITVSVPYVGLEELRVATDGDTVTLNSPQSFTGIVGGTNITTSLNGSGEIVITNDHITNLAEDENPTLISDLNANGFSIAAANAITAQTVTAGQFIGNLTGNVTGLVNGVDPAQTAEYFDGYYDFGDIVITVNSILEWVIAGADVDFGTFGAPDPRTIDAGSF
jgi:hypothetical protein